MSNFSKSFGWILAFAIAFTFGCSNKSASTDPEVIAPSNGNKGALVTDVKTTSDGSRPTVNPNLTSANSITVQLTLNKDAILGEEFLYGADLQYSSLFDQNYDLYTQSLAIGHIPARFRISGDELQLVADNKRLFPSEVNHPEKLLTRFKILSSTDATLTVQAANSQVFLAEIFTGTFSDTQGGLSVGSGLLPKDAWVRSFEYAAKDRLLLQETSIEMPDGSVAEFMESIQPRSALAPGALFQKIKMDPTHPTGGQDGITGRYRLLSGEKIRDGEEILSFAQHYDISSKTDGSPGTIDWYVTPNISDEDLKPVQEAVEAWNRYFKNYSGIQREVVLFKGRLPDGIKIGDPRYNVINWDNRLVAGAAYESQATDPHTGKQSHSLIYMPAAWLKIGRDYWTNGRFSDNSGSVSKQAISHLTGPARASQIACLRDMHEAASLLNSGRHAKGEVEIFGIQLLKQTLMHEVGHALGLGHNFKGSLSYDLSKKGSPFSDSIMDYNNFEIERAAFTAVDSADGPELEYDRQALSAIYNQQKDVKNSDPVLAACNDAEADQESGGVDPLCIRYDIENDPTHGIVTAWNRIQNDKLDGDVTLAQALKRAYDSVVKDGDIASAQTEGDLNRLVLRLVLNLEGSLRYYIVTGKSGLSRVVRNNTKSLLVFAEDVLPQSFQAKDLRERAFGGIQKSLSFMELPPNVKQSLSEVASSFASRILTAPYVQGLDPDQQTALVLKFQLQVMKTATRFERSETTGLAKLRSIVLASLARHESVPYFFGEIDQSKLDFEGAITTLLFEAITVRGKNTQSERLVAASALKTYAGRDAAEDLIEKAVAQIKTEYKLALDNETREAAFELLKILK